MQLISSNLLPVPLAPAQHGVGTDSSSQFGLKYCPSMDLVAIYTHVDSEMNVGIAPNASKVGADPYNLDDEDDDLTVDVYRLNGQKVFSITIDSNGKTTSIVDVAWREDGILLAIITSDNMVRLVNSFSGKVVSTFTTTSDFSSRNSPQSSSLSVGERSPKAKRKSATQDQAPRKRLCTPQSISYSTHLSISNLTRAKLALVGETNKKILDDLRSLHANVDDLLDLEADLPKELANIDVEQYLPKLPTLPANGMGEDDVFATKTSIDAIFHTSKQNTNSYGTDLVAVAQSDGNVHIRIFDSFQVGDIDLNHALAMPTGCVLGNVRRVVSHPLLQKLYVIAEEVEEKASKHSKAQSRTNHSNHKTTHLLSLDLRFLQRSSLALPILATKATQLNNLVRYLQQIEQLLAREIKNAFDLPTRFIRTLEEDLKEQDGDGSTFETSTYHALLTGEVSGKFKEWLVEILGDRGVKRWEKAVSECLDVVRRLTSENWNPAVERAGVAVSRLAGLVASTAFGVEKSLVEGLRDIIDVMALVGEDLLQEVNTEIAGFGAFITWLKREVEAAGLEDTSEKLDEMRDNSDHSEIRSVLKYISQRVRDTSIKKYIVDLAPQETITNDTSLDLGFYRAYRQKRKQTKGHFSPPSMKSLTARLKAYCDQLFAQLGQQLQENVLVEHICPLNEIQNAKVADYWIMNEPENPVLRVFAKDETANGRLLSIQVSLGAKSNQVKTTSLVLEDGADVLDIRCADDDEVFLLIRVSRTAKVLSIGNSTSQEIVTRHIFGEAYDSYIKLGLSPSKLEINGRKGRRTMTVLDEQGRGYGVFDLDSVEAGSSEDQDQVMSD